MKVLQLGNVANLAFHYAKYLRKAGIECDVLVSSDPEDMEVPPEKHPWVRFWTPGNPAGNLAALWKLTREYDLIHAHGGRSLYAQFLRKPFIAHSMGSDLRLVAVKNTPLGILLRRAFKRCDRFFFSQPDQLGLVERMGLNAVFVRQIIDVQKFRPRRAARRAGRLTLFHPSRHQWKTKGIDRFFRAYARFLQECPRAHLTSVYWDAHREKSRELVQQLGIGPNVEFVGLLTEPEMIRRYNESDVVVDEFNVGSFGLVALEAMSCGKPVLRYIDERLHARFFEGRPPIANASSEEEILARLRELTSRKHRQELGAAARRFVLTYHRGEEIARELIEQYEQLVNR